MTRLTPILAGGKRGPAMTIDVWMQHPTARFLRHEMFESLRRWTGDALPEGEIPLETTRRGDGRRRRADRGAERVARAGGADDLQRRGRRVRGGAPGPLRRARRGRSAQADGRRARAAALRPRARLQGPARDPVAVGPAAGRPPLLPALRRVRRARRPVLPAGRPHRAAALLRARAADPVPRQRRARLPRARDRRRPHRLPVDRGDGRAGAQVPERLHRHLRLHDPPLSARARPLPPGGRPQEGPVRLELPDDRAREGARRPRRPRARRRGARAVPGRQRARCSTSRRREPPGGSPTIVRACSRSPASRPTRSAR